MEKKYTFTFFIILSAFLLLLLLPLSSATIILSQPRNIYNLGDMLNITIEITGPIEGILSTGLICEEKKQLFYAEYMDLKENQKKTLFKKLKLKGVKGTCYISAELDEESAKTSDFFISDKINIQFDLERQYLFPGDYLEIRGTALKENAERPEGLMEVWLDDTFLKRFKIDNGKFDEKIFLPKNLTLYEYKLTLKTKDAEALNYGEENKTIYILSLPTSLELEINKPVAGMNLIGHVFLYDQNKKQIKKNVSIIVKSANEKEVIKKQVISGEDFSFPIPDNAVIGDWKTKAFFSDLETTKHFYIGKNEKINSTIEGEILTVKNIGNVPYRKVLVIHLSNLTKNFTKEIFINLDIGEEEKFKISAPEGKYNIGLEKNAFKKVALTGHTIDVKVENKYPKAIKSIFYVILGLLIVSLLFFVIFRRRIKKSGKI